jgi:coproporphyrinogen III oxidase-like Fe-S oxidoreductase
MMGFGPSGISFYSNSAYTEGIKVANIESSSGYIAQIKKGEMPVERFYRYDEQSLRIFYLIRRLSGLSIEISDFIRQFGRGGFLSHSEQFDVLSSAGLIRWQGDAYVPTPKGMFYADSIASLFSDRSEATSPHAAYRTECVDRPREISNADGYM